MRYAWRLGVVLLLLASAWGVLLLAPRADERASVARLYGLPSTMPGWTVVEGAPEGALPLDPNERITIRRTYRRGERSVWVSVALFSRQDLAERRASLNLLYPEKNVTRLDHFSFPVALNGLPDRFHTLPAVAVRREDLRLVVTYWHQLGQSAYGGEYQYRLALLRSALLERRTEMVLVRLAASLDATESPEPALGLFRELAPTIYSQVRGALARP